MSSMHDEQHKHSPARPCSGSTTQLTAAFLLAGLPGVPQVHDLHVWTITSAMISLSAHLVTRHEQPQHRLLGVARRTLHEQFGIDHMTLQIEPEGFREPANRV